MNSDSHLKKRKEAVALRYQAGYDEAPKVVAKGTQYVAERIIETAIASGIPIQEDQTLVSLLGRLDLNQVIPPDLYQAVAEVFAFLYRLDKGNGPK